MKRSYLFEISDAPSPYCSFAYFDTDEHLAHFLFAREQVDVRILGKYGAAEDPYQIVLCTIPRKHRAGFLKAMEDLPELMSRMGKMDYDAFCRSVMLDAAQYLRGERTGDRSIHFHE